MTEKQKALAAIYKSAQDDIYNIIHHSNPIGSPNLYQRNVSSQINQVINNLQTECAKWASQSTESNYHSGIQETTENIKNSFNLTDEELGKKSTMSHSQFGEVKDKSISQLTNNTIAQLSYANSSLGTNLQDVIKQKTQKGVSTKELSQKIQDEIYGTKNKSVDKLSIKGKDGKARNYDPVKYAEMIERTSETEAMNEASVDMAKYMGTEILQMSSHSGACKICAALQGRWYSLNPDNKDFPYIYRTAWKNGYKTVHPNCRHKFTPVDMDSVDEDMLNEMLEVSNKPIDEDGKSQGAVDKYYDTQDKIIEQYKQKQNQQTFDEYRDILGDDYLPDIDKFIEIKEAGGEEWEQLKEDFEISQYLEDKGVTFIKRISDKEFIVDKRKPKIAGKTKHFINNMENKPDREHETIDIAQSYIDNVLLTIYDKNRETIKFVSQNGYAVLNFHNIIITSVPEILRNKYKKFIKEK